METWDYINVYVENRIQDIFAYVPIHTLSDYEKRKTIFEHLTKTLSYDFETLKKIKHSKLTGEKIRRSPTDELLSVMECNHGICNGISQFYKLLLEKFGITAHCVIVDDGTAVNHQMVLVYNEETDTYSFDDITSVIVGRGTIKEYFDYDIEQAEKNGQGHKAIYEDRKYVILPEQYINHVVKRTKSPTSSLEYIPNNIKSLKQKGSIK